MWSCVAVHINDIKVHYTPEISTRTSKTAPIPKTSHSAYFKDIDVCAAMQNDAYPDHLNFVAIMVDFSDTGGQTTGP